MRQFYLKSIMKVKYIWPNGIASIRDQRHPVFWLVVEIYHYLQGFSTIPGLIDSCSNIYIYIYLAKWAIIFHHPHDFPES